MIRPYRPSSKPGQLEFFGRASYECKANTESRQHCNAPPIPSPNFRNPTSQMPRKRMALVANLWQATRHGKQRRTPPRKEKAKKESSSHHGSESARFPLGSAAAPFSAKDLASFLRPSSPSAHL